ESMEELLTGEVEEKPPSSVEQLSGLVRRVVAENPSIMTGPGTNSYVVGRDDVVVIDPGTLDPSHLRALANVAPKISTIVITHRHPDHFTGAVELAGISGAEIAVSRSFAPYDLPETARRLSDGDNVTVPGVTLTALETPGHASDHIALWFEEEKSLFSGDLILGEGTSVISPPDGNLTDYMKSLERVAALPIEHLYPGHHAPRNDPKEWIEYYISHRRERDDQILSALSTGPKDIPAIVAEVYASYPKALHRVAERSVLAHLQKMEGERRVVAEGDTWRKS
ncbi:MAG: MBL fold metallo-hydrolase, partial [Acidimicrobiia bacterium]